MTQTSSGKFPGSVKNIEFCDSFGLCMSRLYGFLRVSSGSVPTSSPRDPKRTDRSEKQRPEN